MVTERNFICRSVLPNGETGAAVGIPAEVRRDVGLKVGADGDKVDLQYDRENETITIFL